MQIDADKVMSDYKMALPQVVVWRYAMTTSGAQCVMISGMMWMPELCATNWDSLVQVCR